VLVGLLRLPVRNPVTLHVHTPMSTLLDLDQRSGWLEGVGPVPALRARMLLPTATLRRVAVDERTGVPLGMDPRTGTSPPWRAEVDLPTRHRHRSRHRRPCPETPPTPAVLRRRLLELASLPMYLTDRAEPQHDPSAALRALARLRDQTCDGPGCPRQVAGCELDHEIPWSEGGPTAIWNLRHRSPRCHHVKHDPDWTVSHDHDSAVSTWTSPTGSSYPRQSPWQPPSAPEDLQLPEPRLLEPLELTPDRPDHDTPLWREPAPRAPRTPRSRGIDPDTVDEHGRPLPPPRPPRATWGDDGPPPF
jgi:hypothetical protein